MKRDEQRVLAGSLNLLTPSDKTPENDAIDLRNWRVDQAGVLRGGDTFQVLVNVDEPIHSLMRLQNFSVTQPGLNGAWQVVFGSPGAFLIGAGTQLFFYWPNGGAESFQVLASGFSGNPLSLVNWNGFIWVMDSLQQLKINPLILSGALTGTAVTSWLPAVPATAITVAADTATFSGELSGTYEYYCTYFLKSGFAGGTLHPNVESAGGPGVTVTAVGGAVSVLGLPVPLFYVDQIRLYRSGGTLTGTLLVKVFDYPFSYPSPSSPWTDIQSDAAIEAVGVHMPTSGATGAPATPTATASVDGGFGLSDATAMVGTYEYYCTFVNSAGLETNPSPVSQPVTPTDGAVALSTIPVSPDADTVKRRIYREGGELGNAYQVVELEDNTTTTYLDQQTDLALEELGIIMPTTNDPPPTGVATDNMGVTAAYFNYLLAWKNGRMYWSQNGIPLFPGSEDGVAEGNWVNVGAPDEKIQTITLHALEAAIYKERTVWRLLGDPVTGTLLQTSAPCGAVSKMAVAHCGTYDLVLSEDGLYKCTMDAMEPVSPQIAPVFLGQQWIQFGASDIAQDVFAPLAYRSICGFLNGTALISNCGGDGVPSQFLFHPETGRWAGFSSNKGSAITAILSWGSQYQWYAGDAAGNLLVSSAQAQTGQQLVWQTRFLDQGTGDDPKSYQELVLDAELNGATATLYVFFDNSGNAGPRSGVAFPYKWTLTGTTRKKFYLALAPDESDTDGTVGDDLYPHISVRVEIACTATGLSPAIHGLYIYYSMEERDAAIRGTDVLDFHSERISLCKKMELDVVGQVDLTVWTDLPGGLALRYTYAGSPSTTRAIVEFPLPPNVRGRLWRVDVLPQNTTARVYGVRGWMREIGLAAEAEWGWRDFVLGTQAETPDGE